jgi:hypothetical protein
MLWALFVFGIGFMTLSICSGFGASLFHMFGYPQHPELTPAQQLKSI